MVKRFLLILNIFLISGCETMNIKKQCAPDKNYIYSNSKLMDEYTNLKNSGKIYSIYSNFSNPKSCFIEDCIKFDNSKIKQYEQNFSGENFGIYTITKKRKLC